MVKANEVLPKLTMRSPETEEEKLRVKKMFEAIFGESPSLIDTTDFGLNDQVKSQEYAKELVAKKMATLRTVAGAEVIVSGTPKEGIVSAISTTAIPETYFISQYKEISTPVGTAVTQTAIWNSKKHTITKRLPSSLVFSFYLKRWDSIVSDTIQTPEGALYWLRLLYEATIKGFQIGYINLDTGTAHKTNLKQYEELETWLTSNGLVTFGKSGEKYRLYISNR